MNEQDFYSDNNEIRYNNIYNSNPAFMEPERKKKKKEKKNGNGAFKKVAFTLLIGVIFGGAAAGSFYAVNRFVLPKTDQAVVKTQTSEEVLALKNRIDELQNQLLTANAGAKGNVIVSDATSVAEKVMPSMVAVTNVGEATFSDWFGRRYTQDTSSCGSGIIIGENDDEYFIATNHHVIEDSKELTVLFVDETEAPAYIKGYDATIDVAVIAVAKSGLDSSTIMQIKVAELGNSDSLKIGEPAIAIGNALGYGQSVTTGVVSALHRDMTIDSMTYEDLIQTSAAINPGNSGGALLNVKGEVIGINSSKVGGNTVEGMGFAIPISRVKDILKDFSDRETRNKVSDDEKGYLGIGGNDTYDLTALGYPAGVYVSKVYENSPAATAGIYMGDIVTKVDGQSVKTISELSEYLSYYRAGEKVTITLTRNVNGELKEMNLDVILGTKDVVNQ